MQKYIPILNVRFKSVFSPFQKTTLAMLSKLTSVTDKNTRTDYPP